MGFRPNLNPDKFLLFLVISVMFAFAITLLAVPFSIKVKSWEGAGGFSYILSMLLFVSSAFVPTEGMAKPIKIFAENQPMTPIIEATRSLLQETTSQNHALIQALIWLAILIVVFGALSYHRYKKVF